MSGVLKRGGKPALWLVLTLLLTLALAIPAQAGIIGAGVDADNPTVCVQSDYILEMATDNGLSTGDSLQIQINDSLFDLNEIDLGSLEMTVNQQVYSIEGSVDNNTLILPINQDVDAGTISFTIKGFTNPEYVGGQLFANSISINHADGSIDPYNEQLYLYTNAPNLTITPFPNEIEYNLRAKLTVTLIDGKDNPFVTPRDIKIDVVTDKSGEFFERAVDGDEIGYWGLSIPQGKSSIELFYKPTEIATHKINAAFNDNEAPYNWGYGTAETTITALAADAVDVLFSDNGTPIQSLKTTAGKAEKITLTAFDQYGKPVKQQTDLVVKLSVFNNTGNFYEVIDNAMGEDPIEEVVIKAGSDSVDLYYCDTGKTYDPNVYCWYSTTISTEISPNYYTPLYVYVAPASAQSLDLKVFDNQSYTTNDWGENNPRLYIANRNRDWQIYSPGNVQHNLLSEMIFPMEITVLDEYGNQKELDSSLTLDLKVESASGAVYGNFYSNIDHYVDPISQVTINETDSKVYLYFVASGSGPATIKAIAPNFGEATFDVNVLSPQKLQIIFPYEENYIEPEERKPVIVVLTDAEGHPAMVDHEINVNLSGGKFYEWEDAANSIDSITIPAWNHGVQVYLEGPETQGNFTINAVDAAGQYNATGDVTVEVAEFAYFCTELERGWNTLSTPIALEGGCNTMDKVVEDISYITSAFKYNEAQSRWQQIYPDANGIWRVKQGTAADAADPEFFFEPQEAIFVKMKGWSAAHFYASKAINPPPTRQLITGWNLVSPAIPTHEDYYEPALDVHYGEGIMPTYKVLINIKDKYSQVVSPSLASQYAWTYVPPNTGLVGDLELLLSGLIGSDVKCMEAGRGYWVYMKEAGELPGFSSTPVYNNYNDYYYN
ncbi:hypothetical protein JCM14036_06980 [Desulfotomaculum defluvii]